MVVNAALENYRGAAFAAGCPRLRAEGGTQDAMASSSRFATRVLRPGHIRHAQAGMKPSKMPPK